MSTAVDRIEHNLKKQIALLETIYESDKRLTEESDATGIEGTRYDDYLDEQNSYISKLEELDEEYDELLSYLKEHKDEIDRADSSRKSKVRSLIGELEGKLQAVNEAETKARELVDRFISSRREELATSRRNVRVIQNNYRPLPSVTAADQSIFDTTN